MLEGCVQIGIVSCATALGVLCTLLVKSLYCTRVHGFAVPFEKPMWTTTLMFVAMSFMLVPYQLLAMRAKRGSNGSRSCASSFFPTQWRILSYLSTIDCLSTIFAKIGLIHVMLSTYQCVRCGIAVFVAFFKVFLFKHPNLTSQQILGVTLNCVGVAVIASPRFFSSKISPSSTIDDRDATDKDPRIGILFLLASILCQAVHLVYEEELLVQDEIHPLAVIGWEGVFGALWMLIVGLPFAEMTGLESTWNSLEMAGSSDRIVFLSFSFMTAVFFFNMFAIYITKLMTSLWHAFMDNLRACFLWGAALLLYYEYGVRNGIGERWTAGSSGVQAIGVLILLASTYIYESASITILQDEDGEERMALLPLNSKQQQEPIEHPLLVRLRAKELQHNNDNNNGTLTSVYQYQQQDRIDDRKRKQPSSLIARLLNS